MQKIYLNEAEVIDGRTYIIGFFFMNKKNYMVSLFNCDKDISAKEEKNRKIIHDKILQKNEIESGKQYPWGKIVSEYDAKSNISSINIYYIE